MKWKWVSKFENWTTYEYFSGRKYGVHIKVYKPTKNYPYHFLIEETKTNQFVFNSLWGSHSDEDQKVRIASIPDMAFKNDQEALEFVEKWIEGHVPRPKKKMKD